MNVQEVIDEIEALLLEIADSDDERIQRDLNDDPFEPVNITILGNTYSYDHAEIIGQHPYHTGEEESCDIQLYLQRDDDIGSRGESKLYEFVCSLAWLKEWRDALKSYLNYDDEKAFIEEYSNSSYPLSSAYVKKSQEYEKGTQEQDVYIAIGMALYYSQDNVAQAIHNFSYNHPEYTEIQKRAIEILQQGVIKCHK